MPEISLSWPQPHHIYYISPGSTAYFFTKAVYGIRSHRRVLSDHTERSFIQDGGRKCRES